MTRFKKWKPPKIVHGKLTKYNALILYPEGLKLGTNVDIGAFCLLECKSKVTIEDNVQIGGGCMIYSRNTIDSTEGPVLLKKGCKIGANTVILPNSTVGENTTIGACSLVKGFVPANCVAYGVPATVKQAATKVLLRDRIIETLRARLSDLK